MKIIRLALLGILLIPFGTSLCKPNSKIASINKIAMTDYKFIFSRFPFTSDREPKTLFKSTDDIFGQLELPTTVEQYFNLPDDKETESFLWYSITVLTDNKVIATSDTQTWMHVSENEKRNTKLQVDVLPGRSTRIFRKEDVTVGATTVPLGGMIDENRFPTDGSYQLKIQVADGTKSIVCEALIDFNFQRKDISELHMRTRAAEEGIQSQLPRSVKPFSSDLPFEWNLKSAPSETGITSSEMQALAMADEDASSRVLKFLIYPTTIKNWMTEQDKAGYLVRYHSQTLYVFIYNSERNSYRFKTGFLQQDTKDGSFGKIYFKYSQMGEYPSASIITKALQNEGK